MIGANTPAGLREVGLHGGKDLTAPLLLLPRPPHLSFRLIADRVGLQHARILFDPSNGTHGPASQKQLKVTHALPAPPRYQCLL